jgi:uncharacterized protein YndB with AHSA1/START domain
MTKKNSTTTTVTRPSEREFVMERLFDAPRELVWQAWTKPEHLVHWWGPKGWTLPVCKIDFRPGGIWHYCMRGPAGEESWGKAVYREIVEPERIVYLDTFADEEGNPVEGMPEMVITVTFEALEGKTKVTAHAQFASAADLESVLAMGMVEGLTQTWDRLEAYLAQA